MEYRTNRKTGDKISVIGFGTSSVAASGEAEAVKTTMTSPRPTP